MGRAYIYWDEIPSDLKCPKCGSRVFRVSGTFKAEYEALVHHNDKENFYEIDEEDYFNEEYRTVDGVVCADCGEELTDLVGL